MFEVTIKTDNQAALQKLLEFLASLDMKILKEPVSDGKNYIVKLPEKETAVSSGKSGKKKIVKWGGMEVDISNIQPGFGCAKGMFEMSPDFDEPLEDFNEYMY